MIRRADIEKISTLNFSENFNLTLLNYILLSGLWKSVDIEEIVGKFGLVCISRAGTDPYRYIYENDVLNKLRYDEQNKV